MALVVRGFARGSSRPHVVRVGRGVTKIKAAPGVRYQFVDDLDGKAPADAVARKAGHDLVITTSHGETIQIEGFYELAGLQSAAFDMPGASMASITPMTELMEAMAAAGDQAAEGAAGAQTSTTAAGGAAGGAASGATGAGAGAGAGAAAGAAAGAGLGTALPIGLGAIAIGGAAAAAGGGGGGGGSGGQSPAADTTPPVAPSGLKLDAADDSGASNSDGITSQTSGLTITGNAEAGSKVEIFNGTTLLATVTASTTGTFTADITLAAGAANITARATDTAGNVGPASAALAITVDTSAPATPTVNLSAASDTGISSGDKITNRTNGLTLTGSAEAGSTVQLFDGTTSIGTATANASGIYALDVALAAGVHSITARATDAAGNVSATSSAMSMTIDTTAPAAPTIDLSAASDTGVSSGDKITSRTSGLTITGAAEAGSTVQIFEGTTLLGTATTNAAGIYAADVSLAVGVHSLTARATDVAGNAGAASSALSITVVGSAGAPTAPEVLSTDDTGISNSDNITQGINTPGTMVREGLVTLLGQSSPGQTVNVYEGTTLLGTVTANAVGTYYISTVLTEGVHNLTARAVNADGSLSASSPARAITMDRTGDSVNLRLDAADDTGLLNSDRVTSKTTGLTVSGIAAPGETVNITAKASSSFAQPTVVATVTADSNGRFSTDISLTPNSPGVYYSIGASVRPDLAGNAAVNSGFALLIDTTAPGAPTLALADASNTGSKADTITSVTTGITFNTAVESDTMMAVFDNGTLIKTIAVRPTADANAAASPLNGITPPYSFNLDLAEGTHQITAQVTDRAGNVGALSAPLTVVVDTTVPAAPSSPQLLAGYDTGVSNSDNITKTVLVSLGGTAEPGAIVEVFDGTTLIATTTATSGGTYGFSSQALLLEGVHNLTARATDGAGNVSPLSAPTVVTVDTTAPTLNSINLAAADDSGSSNSDRITNQTTGLTFSGTADAGTIVGIYVAGGGGASTLLGETTADANGNYSLDISYSGNLGSSLFARPSDLAGNVGTAINFTLVVDTTAPSTPSIPDLAVADDTGVRDYITGQSSGLTFTTSTNETATYRIFDFGTQIGTSSTSTFDLTLTPGEHQISVVAVDVAGNVSAASAARTVTVTAVAATGLDLAAASDTGVSNTDNITSLTTGLVFTGQAAAGAMITLTRHNLTDSSVADAVIGTATADGSGAYTITGDLPAANPAQFPSFQYDVIASGTDNLGNTIAPDKITVTIDNSEAAPTIAPDLSAEDDTGTLNNDNITDQSTGLTFTGALTAGQTMLVVVDGVDMGNATSNGSTYSFDLALASGTHQIAVKSIDLAGNISPASPALSVTVNPGHDDLTGTTGNDFLIGNASANNLFGGLGRDVMVGGAGADNFFLEPPSGQTIELADVIADFEIGIDHIAFDPSLAGSSSITFASLTIAQGTGTHVADTIISSTASGAVLGVLQNIDATQITAASFTF